MSAKGKHHTIQCWYYDVSALYDERTFQVALAALPWQERRAKTERFVFQKDKCLCLGGGLICAYALKKAGAHDLAMGYGPHGKPHLQNHPSIHFNLAHAGSMVVCAVSDAPVGIDVEKLQPFDDGVARLCFTPDEHAWVNRQTDTTSAFTRLWTRKESYLKLLGTGLSKPANSFVATPGSQPEPGVCFYEYQLEDYVLCLCTTFHDGDAVGATLEDALVPREMPPIKSLLAEGL